MSDLRIRVIRPLPKPERRPSRRSALILWMIAAIGLWASSALALLANPLLDGLNPHVQILIGNLLFYLPFVVLPCILLARRTPGLWECWRPNPISPFNTLSVVVLAILGVFFANDLIVLWAIPFQKLGFDVFSTSIPAANNTGELMLSVFCTAVLPGVCEELLFRGTVMPAFEGEGSKRAMWISSILFMLLHGSILGAPTQLMLGMIMAALVFWTDSIYAGIIYHTVHNAATVILQFMQERTLPTDAAAQTEDLLEAVNLAGGMGIFIVEIAMIGGMMLFSLRIFRLRGQLQGVYLEQPQSKRLIRGERWPLILGAALCALLYLSDILVMLGG